MGTADSTGKGGNTDKGDVCKRLMTSERHHFCELVPQTFRVKFEELVTRLWVCIRVYTGKDEVLVQKYKDFCLDTYMLILTNFNNDKGKKNGSRSDQQFIHFWLIHGSSFKKIRERP